MLHKKYPLTLALTLLTCLTVSAFARTSAPKPEPSKYGVDSSHSIVIFNVRHMGVANFYGTFDKITGEISFDSENLADSSVTVEVDSNSIDSNSDDRNELLKGADFFDSENHATWKFESTSVTEAEEGMMTLKGNLTLKGVTKEIEGELELIDQKETRRGKLAGWEARFSIDRTDFGISGVLGGLGKEVNVIVALEGHAKGK